MKSSPAGAILQSDRTPLLKLNLTKHQKKNTLDAIESGGIPGYPSGFSGDARLLWVYPTHKKEPDKEQASQPAPLSGSSFLMNDLPSEQVLLH
ncbi:MAG TPA: hypothetical protein IAB52_05920 [Candidatus Scatomonas merdavium]|nr:hypothetical protein [Candidatus Scatomonas merdavium]